MSRSKEPVSLLTFKVPNSYLFEENKGQIISLRSKLIFPSIVNLSWRKALTECRSAPNCPAKRKHRVALIKNFTQNSCVAFSSSSDRLFEISCIFSVREIWKFRRITGFKSTKVIHHIQKETYFFLSQNFIPTVTTCSYFMFGYVLQLSPLRMQSSADNKLSAKCH